jgi:hypothetical protein
MLWASRAITEVPRATDKSAKNRQHRYPNLKVTQEISGTTASVYSLFDGLRGGSGLT